MQQRHADEVARLHCRCLTGLLSRLGRRTVKAYYEGVAVSPAATALVFLQEGRLVGFVSGSTDPTRLKQEVVRARPGGVLIGLLTGIVRRPTALFHLMASLKAPPPGAYDLQTPELTYLAVATEARGLGIGQRLVEAFGRSLAKEGIDAFELSVDVDNLPAIRFYEKLGFQLQGQYRQFSTLHRRYRAKTD